MLILSFILLFFILTIHEFSHAFAADKLGDPTPQLNGRLTLNPIPHIDPIGTILLPLFLILTQSPFFIGWAKPVPYDPFNLKHPKRDAAVISFAGPLSNLIMAIIGSLILRFMIFIPNIYFPIWTADLLTTFIQLNILLAIFNLIPIHPLDGFRVVAGLIPQKYYHDWLDLERYGLIFLLFMIFPFFGRSPIFTIISPVINFLMVLLIPSQLGGII